MTAQTVPPGRVSTLTAEQEWTLKEVWAHLLNFWGTPAVLPVEKSTAKPKRSATVTSTSSHDKEKEKPKKKFLSRFGKSHHKSKSSKSVKSSIASDQLSTVSTRSRESIEAAYGHAVIHESLKDLQPDEIREHFWSMLRTDQPDNLILRFIRARKWDSDKSLAMLAHSLHWRIKESHPDDIFYKGETDGSDGFMLQLKLNKAYFRGHDNEGRPIVHIRPRLHHSSEQTPEDLERYTLLVIEIARLMLKEPIDSASVLFDLSGFTMANMDYGPVKFMISVFEAHYPESLGKLFIHKAPWIFPPIWNIVKNWLDPVVASKITFTKSTKDLAKHIPMSDIPEELGGDDKFKVEYIPPAEDEDKLMSDLVVKNKLLQERADIVERFLDATVKWIEAESVEESKKWLNEKIAIGDELIANYIKLDPYVRSRTEFDRSGVLKL